jgi:signal transduction histidine kinase/CheY-like chemotaxis protein
MQAKPFLSLRQVLILLTGLGLLPIVLIGAWGINASVISALALNFILAVVIALRIGRSVDRLCEQSTRLAQKQPVYPLPSRIRELNDIGASLAKAAAALDNTERQRASMVEPLNGALESLKDALSRAQLAADTKDDFLAVLGNELRNPLVPIVMALDLMDARAGGHNLRERQSMRRQVNHMRRLLDDLLDVSRITQGKLAMVIEPVCLSTLVMQAIDAARPALPSGRRLIHSGVDAVEALWVTGEEARLLQVATNLLANALRFGGDGDVWVSLRRDGADAVFRVSDTGIGMEPATAVRIFQPFYQAPQLPARALGGLGLGLTIVQSIVELLGGTVRASSHGLGKGSTFEVRLPALEASDSAPPEAPADATAQETKVVIVDDNVDAAHSTAELLSLLGHQVEVANDGKSGLALIVRMQPDVAFLDIELPDIDGFELARAARSAGFRGRLVALTGYGEVRDESRSAQAGFDLHLTKPVDLAALERAIAMAV